jgi:hypothetical protein
MTKWILIENIYNYINPKMKTLHSKNNYIKNYYFDSIKELNNVYGFSNKHMSVLKNKLTIYGKNTKININTASDDILKIIIKYCLKSKQNTIQINYIFLNKLFKTWKQKHKKKNKNITLNKFIFFLKKRNLNLSRNCTYAIGEKSKLFTIRSIAKINGTIKKIKIITEILKKNEKTYYYNNF